MIKKFLHISLPLLFFTGIIYAQENKFEPEISWGINAGLTSSSISFTPSVSQKKLNQAVGGLSVRYITEKHFGLQGELNLSQRGWKEQKDSIPDHKYTKSLLYAEFPLMTHIYFDLSSHVRLLFNLGPQISYLLAEKVKEDNVILDPGTEDQPEPIQYYTDVQNKFDWGITAGGGLEFRTPIGSFVAEARYYYGLSDIYNNRKSDYYAASSNQVINLKVTYFFQK